MWGAVMRGPVLRSRNGRAAGCPGNRNAVRVLTARPLVGDVMGWRPKWKPLTSSYAGYLNTYPSGAFPCWSSVLSGRLFLCSRVPSPASSACLPGLFYVALLGSLLGTEAIFCCFEDSSAISGNVPIPSLWYAQGPSLSFHLGLVVHHESGMTSVGVMPI